MISIHKPDGELLAWTATFQTKTLPDGVILVASPRVFLSQALTIAHVDGGHLLELFKGGGVLRTDEGKAEVLGPSNIVHGKFMLYEAGEPELRGACFAVVPEGAKVPRLGMLVSSAAALIREHGYEAPA